VPDDDRVRWAIAQQTQLARPGSLDVAATLEAGRVDAGRLPATLDAGRLGPGGGEVGRRGRIRALSAAGAVIAGQVPATTLTLKLLIPPTPLALLIQPHYGTSLRASGSCLHR
jgi:hypothetical protein